MKTIGIQGIAYDDKSSFLKGAAKAPAAIRKTLHSGSSNYFTELGINVDTPQIADHGDFEVEEYFDIESITRNNLCKSNRLLTLGGDHSITYPVVKAFSQSYGALEILHLDAHSDLYHKFEGDPYSHACPFARIMEEGLATRLVQVGVRALTDHQREQIAKYQVEVHEMRNLGSLLELQFAGPLYLSLDMDVFDPAYAPGVSHHEPGGLSPREALNIVQGLASPMVGADVVEYNPVRDNSEITAALAAKMMREILGKMLAV